LGTSLILLAYCDWPGTRVPDDLAWTAAFLPVTLVFFLVRYWGQGMLTIASRNMIGKWFNHRRSLAVGVSRTADHVPRQIREHGLRTYRT